MKFSVIIPVYNVAPYLRACLDSVLAAAKTLSEKCKVKSEECADVEIICVDDGSTDGSGAMLDAYADEVEKRGGGGQRIPRLRVLHQPNAGVAAARNRGLDAATGEWLLFVDSDDIVRDTLFSDLMAVMSRCGENDLFGFGQRLIGDDAEGSQWSAEPQLTEVRYDLETSLPDICTCLSAYRFVYRRDRYGNIRFPPYAHGEDLVYVARVLARARSLVFLPREEYGYRDRASSAVHTEMTPAIVCEAVRFHREMFCTLAESGKSLGPRLWPMRLEQWILRIPIILSGQKRDAELAAAWTEWRQSMSVASGLPYVTGMLRVVARLGGRCPCPVLIALACRIGLRLLKARH